MARVDATPPGTRARLQIASLAENDCENGSEGKRHLWHRIPRERAMLDTATGSRKLPQT